MVSKDLGKCKLCSVYDFRQVAIEDINGYRISLTGSLNQVNNDNCFKYCPLCGRKLTVDDFKDKESCE